MEETALKERLSLVMPLLNERQRRRLLAAEARTLGRGGISAVARASGVSRPSIHAGLRELKMTPEGLPARDRVRRPGGGRKRLTEVDP